MQRNLNFSSGTPKETGSCFVLAPRTPDSGPGFSFRVGVTRRAAKGFTLMELLVTISIIGVLMALLIPVYQNGVEAARTVGCLHNLRKVSVKVLAAAAENNGSLAWYQKPLSTRSMWWHKAFIGDEFSDFNKSMICPSRVSPYKMRYKYKGKTLWSTYGYNKHLGYQEGGKEGNPGKWIYPLKVLASIKYPSRIAMIGCFEFADPDGNSDSLGMEIWEPVYRAHKKETVGTVVAVDGHAAQIRVDGENPFVFLVD